MPLTLARRPFARGSAPPGPLASFLDKMLTGIEQALVPQGVKLVDDDYVATVNDQTITVDATAGPVTVGLQAPDRVGYATWTIKKLDASANAVTIGATVDGVVSPTLATQWKSITVQSDGNQFLRIGGV